MFRFALLAMLMFSGLGLAGCSTSDVHLAYNPSVSVSAGGPPSVAIVTAVDRRKEEPNRLATIMGTFGNPIKILNTTSPVKDEVVSVFTKGLQARGLLGNDGRAPFRVDLLIRKFDADMIMGSTARIDLDLTVVDTATGLPVYKDTVVDERSDFAVFAVGIFADIGDMQKLAQTVLDATVDHTLDKPAFRAAIARAPTS